MANSLRSSAPISSMKGVTVASIPDDGSSLTVSFNGQNYLLTMVKGEVVVTGGELDRVSAFFEAVTGGFSLKVAAPDGVLSLVHNSPYQLPFQVILTQLHSLE